MQNKKDILISLGLGLLSVLITAAVYQVLDEVVPGSDVNLTGRGIETPLKLLLNGYFGMFFGFHYLGNINWLIIPLFVLLILSGHKLTRAEKAFVLFFILSFGLIAVKGFFNSRYQQTLLPVCIFLVFTLTWKILSKRPGSSKLMPFLFLFILLLAGFNFKKYAWGNRAKKHFEKTFAAPSQEPVLTKDSAKQVNNLLHYIDSLPNPENWTFLVNNLPDFYYHTSKKGMYYWCADDHYYSPDGKIFLIKGRSSGEISHYLVDALHCRYIYSEESYNDFNPDFKKYLQEHCTLIAKDKDKRVLYQINQPGE